MDHCTAIVLAAGAGKRMQSNVAKQYLILEEKPVIWYALQAFEQSPIIEDVVLVVGAGEIPFCEEEIVKKYGFSKVAAVVEGGSERYLSVWKGLEWIDTHLEKERKAYVFIHDGARPFVTDTIIKDTYEDAEKYGACVAAMPVKDTIKIADEQEFAIQTPNRKTIWMVQTPQVFERQLIINAYRQLIFNLDELIGRGVEITDDAMVVETMTKRPVKLVKASYENIKITTPEDMKIARSLL